MNWTAGREEDGPVSYIQIGNQVVIITDRDTAGRLLKGALILSAAAVISKLIGTLQKIPMQNIGGDGVFGIYNTVYPFYTVLITIAAAGFPVAISKFVAEYEAAGDREGGQRVIRLSSLLLGVFGLLVGLLTYTGAPLLGSLIDNTHVIPSIRAAAAAFLFVPVMSALRGYFQGLQNMVPTAVSQVLEQTVRVAVMIILLLMMVRQGWGPERIAAGAILGSAAGGAAGLVVMLIYWKRHIRTAGRMSVNIHQAAASRGGSVVTRAEKADALGEIQAGQFESEYSARSRLQGRRQLAAALLRYALPVCLSALAVPLINLVDTFTVPRLLKREGLDEAGVMIVFGIYNRGLPLVQLIMMFAMTLSALFIPSLAEAKLKGETELVRKQCGLSLRWFWLLGLASAVGLAVLAEPINIMLYTDNRGSTVMSWMALTAVGGSVSIISAALLQGLGAVRAPAVHMLAAAAAKAALNWLLVPSLGTTGAAIAGAAAYLLAAALNIALLARLAGLRLTWSAVVLKPALALAAMAVAAAGTAWGTGATLGALGAADGGRTSAAAASLLGVAAGAAVFMLAAIKARLLTEAELAALPKLGPPLVRLLRSMRVLR
ncbi:polysaccharide biosynthesis protein [Paenibacillus sp. P96]|uniref:Polysaccharide biosynthesis protein n=1 Tax=Paenibacillus zeirhizosphaerae TaxID=2987519 RepID=A0ABT9FX24_9BACL|nr:polysaccharide biosynthesis protein [Paenibacillus sp. P96]MDP4099185.1 polysaccharide biosynthesis protein [Paenibacillus sp. P96]